jgi:hypothetical protein
MKKNVIVFGLISGLIVSGWMAFNIARCYSTGKFEGSMVLGYASMILAFSLVFVGIKNYRDKYNGGVISFGKAFKLGLYIALISSTMYVLVWLFAYYNFFPDFMDKYGAHMLTKAQQSGATAAQLAAKTDEINSMKKMYSTPLGVTLLTYAEILPVGLLVTLIAALILKRKNNNNGAIAV